MDRKFNELLYKFRGKDEKDLLGWRKNVWSKNRDPGIFKILMSFPVIVHQFCLSLKTHIKNSYELPASILLTLSQIWTLASHTSIHIPSQTCTVSCAATLLNLPVE